MPSHHGLTKCGLPSANVIMRYYDYWQEPFEIYYALYKKVGGASDNIISTGQEENGD